MSDFSLARCNSPDFDILFQKHHGVGSSLWEYVEEKGETDKSGFELSTP